MSLRCVVTVLLYFAVFGRPCAFGAGCRSVRFAEYSFSGNQVVPCATRYRSLRAVVAEALATRSFAQMNTAQLAGVASQEASGKAKQSPQEFPQCPGEDVHAHAATQFLEAVEARWAARGLLVVANGGSPSMEQRIRESTDPAQGVLLPEGRLCKV